jgi:hypothetical protein
MNGLETRFSEAKYEKDEPVWIGRILPNEQPDYARGIEVPESLFARLIWLGQAYDLHVLSSTDLSGPVRLTTPQCESFLEELAFVQAVVNDPLLTKIIPVLQAEVSVCARDRRFELLIEGP